MYRLDLQVAPTRNVSWRGLGSVYLSLRHMLADESYRTGFDTMPDGIASLREELEHGDTDVTALAAPDFMVVAPEVEDPIGDQASGGESAEAQDPANAAHHDGDGGSAAAAGAGAADNPVVVEPADTAEAPVPVAVPSQETTAANSAAVREALLLTRRRKWELAARLESLTLGCFVASIACDAVPFKTSINAALSGPAPCVFRKLVSVCLVPMLDVSGGEAAANTCKVLRRLTGLLVNQVGLAVCVLSSGRI